MARAEKKVKRIGNSLLAKVLLLVLLGAMGWQLYSLQGQVEAAAEEQQLLTNQVEALRQENAAMAADIAEGPTQEKMEEIARHEMGMIYPNERVLIDTSN